VFSSTVRQPSALIPLAMSLAGLALLIGHVALFGVTPAAPAEDEGISARLWQFLVAGQLPVVAYFALKWLPRRPREALLVLALQAGAALASIVPVFLLEL
jgi:hypothetical protein